MVRLGPQMAGKYKAALERAQRRSQPTIATEPGEVPLSASWVAEATKCLDAESGKTEEDKSRTFWPVSRKYWLSQLSDLVRVLLRIASCAKLTESD